MSLFKTSITGIDLGKKAVKLAHCESKNGTRVIKRAFLLELPAGNPDDIYLDVALDAIVRNKKSHKMPLNNVAVVCPGELYKSLNVSFPVMPKNELRSAIQWEIKRVSGIEPESVNFDYYPNLIKESETEYIVYYAERERINGLILKFKKYGITLRYIDVEDMVYIGGFNAFYTDDGSVKGFFDMGYSKSKLIIAKGGSHKFNRELSYNLKTIYDNAKTYDSADMQGADAIEVRGFSDEILGRMLSEYLSELIYELSRSIDYFTANYRLSSPTNIFLSGGLFRIPGVLDFFQKNITYPVTMNNVFDAAGYYGDDMTKTGFMFNLAAGVAVR